MLLPLVAAPLEARSVGRLRRTLVPSYGGETGRIDVTRQPRLVARFVNSSAS